METAGSDEVIPITSEGKGAASPVQTRTTSKVPQNKSSMPSMPSTGAGAAAASPSQSVSAKNGNNTAQTHTIITPTSNSVSSSTKTSPAPSYSSATVTAAGRPTFTIPTLPEYSASASNSSTVAGTKAVASNPAAGTSVNSQDSTTNSEAVLLGIQTLERQQLEKELKRQREIEIYSRNNNLNNSNSNSGNMSGAGTSNTNTSAIRRHNPFDTTPVGMMRPQDHSGLPSTVHLSGQADDELTITSDLKGLNGPPPKSAVKKTGTRARFDSFSKVLLTPLKPIKRSISDRFNIDPTPTRPVIEEGQEVEAIIFGYLHKLGRNKKWQRRWFESDGTCLKYYKSEQKEKSLAKLDLHRVGDIMMDPSDSSDCTFMIEVAARQYYLCADTKEKTMDWVITLNRVKEARMNIGGLRLMDPDFVGHGGKRAKHRSTGSDSDEENAMVPVSTRMVMNAMPSRSRTKKIGKDDYSDMEKSIEEVDSNADGPISLMLTSTKSPSAGTNSLTSASPRHRNVNLDGNGNGSGNGNLGTFLNPSQNSLLPLAVTNQVVVRWTKQRSKVQNWARRLSRWAKRMTMVRCVIQDDVVHLSELQAAQRRLENEKNSSGSESDGKEEPFIDLDIASYSDPRPYVEGQGYGEEMYNTKPAPKTYDFVDHSANSSIQHSIQHSSSWKVQKNDPVISSAGSSIQSSNGRISPAALQDDDGSGITSGSRIT